ncbi:hypothetical protein BKA62DRAFT_774463 [Auriculariales sp. MPI-PUGE-AT-0066]|nr:hypothetical protein BKA62DRAFT_774463 [Auriculariales sp. MPI-PUGE-AT-0066]
MVLWNPFRVFRQAYDLFIVTAPRPTPAPAFVIPAPSRPMDGALHITLESPHLAEMMMSNIPLIMHINSSPPSVLPDIEIERRFRRNRLGCISHHLLTMSHKCQTIWTIWRNSSSYAGRPEVGQGKQRLLGYFSARGALVHLSF